MKKTKRFALAIMACMMSVMAMADSRHAHQAAELIKHFK